MFEWYKMAFEKYADFTSRSTRNEFWWFVLCNFLIILGISFMGGLFGDLMGSETIAMLFTGILVLYYLATFIPNLALSIRRLHDTNRSGWFLLLSLIPLIGSIILIVFWAQESYPGANKWGPVPGSSDSLEDALVDFDKDLV